MATWDYTKRNKGIHWGSNGIMENKMETTIVYRGYIGIMENKLETTIVYRGYIRIISKSSKARPIMTYPS